MIARISNLLGQQVTATPTAHGVHYQAANKNGFFLQRGHIASPEHIADCLRGLP